MLAPPVVGPRRARRLFAVVAAVACAGLLVAGRHGTFRQDEWAVIGAPPTSPASYLLPHNEHWSTIPRLVYQALLDVVGLRSYLPYLAVLLALHLAATAGAFVLLARRLAPIAALIAVLPLLVLGSGWENLLWAFQVGFVGSVAAGTWALVVLEGDRRGAGPLGAALLVLALACSTMGLFFLLAAAIRLMIDAGRRRRIAWLGLPVAAFGAWYVGFGRGAVSDDLASPVSAATFAVRGLSYALGRLTGLDLAGRAPPVGQLAGLALATAGVAVLAWLVARRRLPALAIGATAAALAMYALIGLARADHGGDFWNRSRYVYVAAFLLLPAVADAVRASGLGRSRLPRGVLLAGALLVALSLGANLLDLRAGRAQLIRDAELTRASLAIVEQHRGASWLDWRGLPYGWTDFDTINWILDRYGSPVDDVLVPSNVTVPGPATRDQALIGLSISSFRVEPAAQPSAGDPVEPATTGILGVDLSRDGDCLVGLARAGGSVTLLVPGGGWLEIDRRSSAAATVSLGRELAPSGRFVLGVPPAARVLQVSTPDPGDGPPWQVELTLPPDDGPARLCVRRP
jgi:hypothetical protein